MPTPSNADPDWTKQRVVKANGIWTVEGHPMNTVTINWHEEMSNAPGKSYIGLRVTCPPNAATPPHRHGGASVAATVIKGRVLNQMICADGTVIGPQVYETGESWFEAPGCHHVQCRNAGGEGEEAVFVAGFVVDGEVVREKGIVRGLTRFDADEEESKGAE